MRYKTKLVFFDIDETVFHTYAKVNVVKNNQIIKKLTNQEFNSYKLNADEKFDFTEFQDSEIFYNTSKPIGNIVKLVKHYIKRNDRVIFLTARSDFNDKERFLQTFRDNGIDIDKPNVYVERSGNLVNVKSVAERKKIIIKKYLKSGLYSIIKMFDDDKNNLKTFAELGDEVNHKDNLLYDKIKDNYPKIKKIQFIPSLVMGNGKINHN